MNVKVGLIGVFDMLKFKNLRKKVKRSEIQEPQSDEGGFEQIK